MCILELLLNSLAVKHLNKLELVSNYNSTITKLIYLINLHTFYIFNYKTTRTKTHTKNKLIFYYLFNKLFLSISSELFLKINFNTQTTGLGY